MRVIEVPESDPWPKWIDDTQVVEGTHKPVFVRPVLARGDDGEVAWPSVQIRIGGLRRPWSLGAKFNGHDLAEAEDKADRLRADADSAGDPGTVGFTVQLRRTAVKTTLTSADARRVAPAIDEARLLLEGPPSGPPDPAGEGRPQQKEGAVQQSRDAPEPIPGPVLAHLAGLFRLRENASTEALAHILNTSASAREALHDVIRSGVQDAGSIVRARTQVVGPGGARPDLVGEDEAARKGVIVEVKFWAPLMPTQPNAYLELLPLDGPAVVLFLVPDDRIATLWPVLRKRAGVGFAGRLSEVDAGGRCVQVGDSRRHLMVTGWTRLLDCMETHARDAGETQVEADVRQLRGLADYEIARGRFRPFDTRHDTFGPGKGDRDRDLRRIIDSATKLGDGAGWLTKSRLKRVSRSYGYGRFVRFSGSNVLAWFGINYVRYERNGETPLWLWFYKPALRRERLNDAQLDALRNQCRLRDQWVPLVLKRGVEFSDVVDGVTNHLERVSLLLRNNRGRLRRKLPAWVTGRSRGW